MRHDTSDREKQRAADEHSQHQAQTREEMRVAKDQYFYTRLGLSGPEAEAGAPNDAFIISIHCERWTHQDLEAGEASSHDIGLDRVTVDVDELVQHGQQYGFSEPSSSNPRMSSEVWFRSTFPPEDRTNFEQGVQKHYSLHIHEVNGHPPAHTDYQRVAVLIGVRFDHALQRQEQGPEQEGPDLCL